MFYVFLDASKQEYKSQEMVLVVDDFKKKIGKTKNVDITRKFGLGLKMNQ